MPGEIHSVDSGLCHDEKLFFLSFLFPGTFRSRSDKRCPLLIHMSCCVVQKGVLSLQVLLCLALKRASCTGKGSSMDYIQVKHKDKKALCRVVLHSSG
jgi:hypothetical protein